MARRLHGSAGSAETHQPVRVPAELQASEGMSPEWSVGALTAALDLSAVTVVNIWQCVTHPRRDSMSRTKPGIFGAYKNSELGTASNVFVTLRPHVLQLCARQQQSALKGCWASSTNPSEAAFKQLLLHPHVRLKQQKPVWVTPTGFSTYPRMLPALEPQLRGSHGDAAGIFLLLAQGKHYQR